ncbi:MAG: right-handed parallel beta-helix repeat-containing protein [Verrucomicrobiales bacterium]|nr:right-handed parallel beta-helix repeat-containing protein [Verrucomicrobiales bacterium]
MAASEGWRSRLSGPHLLSHSTRWPRIRLFGLLRLGIAAAGLMAGGIRAIAADPIQIQVTSTADAGPGSLREAMVAANEAGEAVIDLRTVQGTIVLGSGLPRLTGKVTLSGPESGTLTLSGAGAHPILATGSDSRTVIRRLQFAEARATGYRNGAAIQNLGTLELDHCFFLRNTNQYGWGGAVYSSGDLRITHTRFEGNEAWGEPGSPGHLLEDPAFPPGSYLNILGGVGPGGGAAGMGGALFHESGSLVLSNCVLIGNRAIGGAGGALDHAAGTGNGGGPSGGRVRDREDLPSDVAKGGFGSGGAGLVRQGAVLAAATGSGGFGGGGNPGGFGAGWTGPGEAMTGGGGAGAGMGGALFARSGTVHLVATTFLDNQVEGGSGGGGIQTGGGAGDALGAGLLALTGQVTVERCVFEGNRSQGASGGEASTMPFSWGGGGGGAARGGGIYTHSVQAWISESLLRSNHCQGGVSGTGRMGSRGGDGTGGGLASLLAQVEITRSTFAGNQVKGGTGSGLRGSSGLGYAYGGGLSFDGGRGRIENCTISGNLAGAGGSMSEPFNERLVTEPHNPVGNGGGVGLYASMGSPEVTLRYCTLVSNSAAGISIYRDLILYIGAWGGSGGGVWSHSNAVVRLAAVVLAGNQAATPGDVAGPLVSLSRNLVQSFGPGATPAPTDLVGEDPRLGPLQDNGGGFLTHAPLAGSAILDAAGESTWPDTDQRGWPRVAGVAADLGAVEWSTLIPYPEVSRLTQVRRAAGSAAEIEFRVEGRQGKTLVLESSSDLAHWQEIGRPVHSSQIRQALMPGALFFRLTEAE